ncbi:MAG TPA: PaaI family thioesterase [Longimicrobiales bacterium]
MTQPYAGPESLLEVARRMIAGEIEIPPIARTLGFTMTHIEEGSARFEMDAEPDRHANPMGTLHGGVLCTIADSAMGMAFASTLARGESFTTLEIKINYLRPAWRTHLIADARVVKRGRDIGLTECDVVDADGNLLAHATSTCMVLRGEKAAGR